jgi:hypothetical protein
MMGLPMLDAILFHSDGGTAEQHYIIGDRAMHNAFVSQE